MWNYFIDIQCISQIKKQYCLKCYASKWINVLDFCSQCFAESALKTMSTVIIIALFFKLYFIPLFWYASLASIMEMDVFGTKLACRITSDSTQFARFLINLMDQSTVFLRIIYKQTLFRFAHIYILLVLEDHRFNFILF